VPKSQPSRSSASPSSSAEEPMSEGVVRCKSELDMFAPPPGCKKNRRSQSRWRVHEDPRHSESRRNRRRPIRLRPIRPGWKPLKQQWTRREARGRLPTCCSGRKSSYRATRGLRAMSSPGFSSSSARRRRWRSSTYRARRDRHGCASSMRVSPSVARERALGHATDLAVCDSVAPLRASRAHTSHAPTSAVPRPGVRPASRAHARRV
jgi:hypothetical protein